MWSLSRLRSSFHGRSNSASSASPSASSKCSRRNPFGRSLRLEPLEDRRLLSVDIGCYVRVDVDRDGHYSSGDAAFKDVLVQVYSSTDKVIGNTDDVLQYSHATYSDGYVNTGLFPAGLNYYLKVVAPTGYTFAAQQSEHNEVDVNGVTPLLTIPDEDYVACEVLLVGTSTSWSYQAGSPSGSSCGNAVVYDADGNACVTGYFSGAVDFDPGEGETILSSTSQHAFVAKYTTDGDLLWASDLAPLSAANGIDIAVDADGYVYTTGSYADGDGGGFFVSKLNANGTAVWTKTVSLPGYQAGVDDGSIASL